jgi:hypothetical protein
MNTDSGHGRADGQPVQSHRPGEDHAGQAARLDHENPQWIVIWGIFSHQFVAFPLFRVPPGTVHCYRSESELLRQMRQTENIYGRSL